MRGKFADALVLLGSATPSLESFFNTRQQRYAVETLPRQVLDRALATVRVVNMREVPPLMGPTSCFRVRSDRPSPTESNGASKSLCC